MKRYILFTLVIVIGFLSYSSYSCKKDEKASSNAQILGFDQRLCPCCGGWIISIDNTLTPNGDSTFLAEDFPTGFEVGDTPVFPIPVMIEWKIDTARCNGTFVNISKIERR
jgi:hypothetical protein